MSRIPRPVDRHYLKRQALDTTHSPCAALSHPAAAVLLKWLVNEAQRSLLMYGALAAWSVCIAQRIAPRLVVPWNPRRERWHRMYVYAVDVTWTKRADLCEHLQLGCLAALEQLRLHVRTAKKLRAPLLSNFACRLQASSAGSTSLRSWAARACGLPHGVRPTAWPRLDAVSLPRRCRNHCSDRCISTRELTRTPRKSFKIGQLLF